MIERMAAEGERNVSENNELRKTIAIMEQNYAYMKRLRDAAVKDLEYAAKYNCGKCGVCKHHDALWLQSGCNLINNCEECKWEWRGLCAENGGESDE